MRGSPTQQTALWLADLGDVLYARLVAVGLVEERESAVVPMLEKFLADYIAKRTDVKDRTIISFRQVNGCLLEFFSPTRRLDKITPGDAEDFR